MTPHLTSAQAQAEHRDATDEWLDEAWSTGCYSRATRLAARRATAAISAAVAAEQAERDHVIDLDAVLT